jgi:hypothetical protein
MFASQTPLRALATLAAMTLTMTVAVFASAASAAIVRGSDGQFLGVTLSAGSGPIVGSRASDASASAQQDPAGLGEVSYHGGPVVHSSAPYLVFWTPPGESIASGSQSLLARYLSDVAADSGKVDDVFGVDRQYYDRAGFVDYRQAFDPARQVILDAHPYPARDATHCPDLVTSYRTCVTDGQLEAELGRLIAADGLPSAGRRSGFVADAPIYIVIVPADVNVCVGGGLICADNALCAYHGDFRIRHGGTVLYVGIPVQASATVAGPGWPKICQHDDITAPQEPNGDNADVLIGLLSHEYSETLTDPISPTGWYSTDSGNEIGDDCQVAGPLAPADFSNPNAYAPVLGGTAAAGTLFDQVINNHPYYTQSEWSNGDRTCELRPTPGTIAPTIDAPARTEARMQLTLSPAHSTSTYRVSSATWSFGDGAPAGFLSGRAALTPARHVYAKPGSYTITLTLVDDRGNVQSTTRTISVSSPVCIVPKLTGESLPRSLAAIRAAHCKVGAVKTRPRPEHKHWILVVSHQTPHAGTVASAGTRVALTLIYERLRRSPR